MKDHKDNQKTMATGLTQYLFTTCLIKYLPTRLQPAKYCTVVYSQDGCPAIQATAVAVGNRYRMAAEHQLLHSGCISASYISQLCLIG